MNIFLKEARKCLTLKLCALSLSFFYTKCPKVVEDLPVNTHIIPLLNTTRANLPLKTEVTYFLAKNGILLENVICIDDVFSSLLDISKFILVDHHVSPFNKQATKVIDHHPFDSASNLPAECKIRIEEVGSCATLIADSIFQSDIDTNCQDIIELLRMLYAPIILDTVNFSKEADKARPLDQLICDNLEALLNVTESDRKNLFNELVTARSDVTSLDSLQILSKDLKIISSMDGNRVVAIPGYPISVQDYINMPKSKENLLKFADINQCDVIVLMGMKVVDGIVSRDLGIVNIRDHQLFDKIVEHLVNENSLLDLQQMEEIHFLDGKFFVQSNVKASRKQILPMVKKVLDELYAK